MKQFESDTLAEGNMAAFEICVWERARLNGRAALNGNDAAQQPARPSAKRWASPSSRLRYLLVSSTAWVETSHRGPLLHAPSPAGPEQHCGLTHLFVLPICYFAPCLCCCVYIRDPSGCCGWSTPICIPGLTLHAGRELIILQNFQQGYTFFLKKNINSYEGNEFFLRPLFLVKPFRMKRTHHHNVLGYARRVWGEQLFWISHCSFGQ